MTTVRKSVIVPQSCTEMFELVDDVERYPEFLPWCSGSKVLERTPEFTLARLEVGYHGLESHFTTRNHKVRPESMDLELVDGPFEKLDGRWRFKALGEEGCKVELTLEYAFSNAALAALLGGVFGHIAETMVESFVERAASPRLPRHAKR
jgi:ribosome-associated toxin RatA of RatAB toxin-antitoxin module